MTERPLPGSSTPWDEWLIHHFPRAVTAPFAPRHRALWDWLDALVPGTAPRPFVGIWGRGGAKSSTVEMGAARLCARLTRRFVLYVCEGQDQANKHIAAISNKLEILGVDRATNKFGRVRSWNMEQLRTANGFNVVAMGLDTAARGVKLDDFRPDLIIFDDVDGLHDSIQVTQKKVESITQSILPAGSPDCAVLFVQNLIHANSIASQLADGRADFLFNRLPVVVHPAVTGLAYETDESGETPLYRITAGEATWEGQPLSVCEQQMNTWGLRAFLREAQHDVHASGSQFFPEFQGLDYGGPGLDGRHVILPDDIPAHWQMFGGLDWGYRAPFCFLLGAVDEHGDVVIIDEVFAPRLTNPEQAEAVKRCILSHGRRLGDVQIAADPAMWAKKVRGDGIAEADIEAFWSAGLDCVQANNNRAHGFSNLRNYFAAPRGIRIYKGRCPNLLRTLPAAVYSKTKVEDLDDDADLPPGHMDAVAALRYALGQRVRASKALPVEKTQGEIDAEVAAVHRARLVARLVGHKVETEEWSL